MYKPLHFVEPRMEELRDVVAQWPLGLLMTQQAGELAADPIPFDWVSAENQSSELIGHVAKANPITRCQEGADVLVVFMGPQHYVSPNFYPSKRSDPKVVPTWNYAMVQIVGRLQFVTDSKELLNIVTHLTNRHERAQPHPWKVSDAPPEYIDQMLKAIVGIRINITKVEGKFKASQNRLAHDRQGIREAQPNGLADSQLKLTVREPFSHDQ